MVRVTLRSPVDIDQILSNLVSSVDGALGAALGGMDGLLIEQFSNEIKLNLGNVVAEHSNILRNTRTAYATSLSAGEVHEIFIATDMVLGFTKSINEDFFVSLMLEPTGNIGKARLLLEQTARQLKGLLS